MDKDVVLKWLKEVLLTDADKIFHNAMYDVCWLRAMGFKINGRIIDTMIATSLIDENRGRYDLNSICKDYIHESKNEYALQDAAKSWGVDPKQEMYKLPAIYVGEYAEKDAELTLKLWQACKQKLKAEEVESIFDLETSLIPCLIDMRFK
jgi:DNA polymerase I-like protein with 3'-5' exonuclease and polymerase domains